MSKSFKDEHPLGEYIIPYVLYQWLDEKEVMMREEMRLKGRERGCHDETQT
jgi:hypothetical protein